MKTAVELLEALCCEASQQSIGATSKSQEEVLVQIIQRRLPEDDQIRLTYLRQQNESDEITEAEHQELLAYVDQVELEDAERAEALIELAKIRGVDLQTLVSEYLPSHRVSNGV
ncbi:hypothetical protein [Iningainema tapete]|uniref:hypothetical protein n=1 Tax=Iningainema tapete TaxID=2806730 RepID=UPI001EE20EF6|nr:hypothetical protein [Iningainema tapete]